MRRRLFAVALICLAAAPAGAATWRKPGATPSETAAALGACRKYVEDNFDEDGDYTSPIGRTPDAERIMRREMARREMLERCMRERGYTRRR